MTPCLRYPKLPFLRIWELALKRVRSPSLFANPILFQEGGVRTVDLSKGVKRSATSWFLIDAAFVRAERKSPSGILPQDCNVHKYGRRIAPFVFTFEQGEPTNPLPTERVSQRARSAKPSIHGMVGSKTKSQSWSSKVRGEVSALEGRQTTNRR